MLFLKTTITSEEKHVMKNKKAQTEKHNFKVHPEVSKIEKLHLGDWSYILFYFIIASAIQHMGS